MVHHRGKGPPKIIVFFSTYLSCMFHEPKVVSSEQQKTENRGTEMLLSVQVLEICFPGQTSPLKEQSLKVNHKLLLC